MPVVRVNMHPLITISISSESAVPLIKSPFFLKPVLAEASVNRKHSRIVVSSNSTFKRLLYFMAGELYILFQRNYAEWFLLSLERGLRLFDRSR